MYDELVQRLRREAETERYLLPHSSLVTIQLLEEAAHAIEELSKPHWVLVKERLPECEWGAEVGNIEWISCGMVFAGCFGRGGKYRDAYFRTWTDGAEGIDAKDADYWRPIQIPEPPKEET